MKRVFSNVPEWAWVALGALVAFVVYASCRLPGFGEQDSARLAEDSVLWHFARSVAIDDFDYRLRTSPLYIHFIKVALDVGLPIRRVPALMNWFGAFMSGVCLAGLYYLFKVFSERALAATAVALCALTPGFWVCSIYGIPTIPGLTLWVLSALAFARACTLERWRDPKFTAFVILSGLLGFLALSLKADLILCSGLFLALALKQRGRRLFLMATAAATVTTALGASLLYTHAISSTHSAFGHESQRQSLSDFSSGWSTRFPFDVDYLLNANNSATITHAAGSVLFATMAVAVLSGLLAGGKSAQIARAATLAAVPTILFWGLKSGNSARHNVPALPLLVLAACNLFFVATGSAARARLLVALVLLFSCLDTTGRGSVVPPANLQLLTQQLHTSSHQLHQSARDFLRQPGPRKALIEGYLSAYDEFEAFALEGRLRFDPVAMEITREPDQHIRLVHVRDSGDARRRAQALRDEGWQVFSLQYKL
ncbi:MAG TPA: hypothetical protein VGI10_20850 [Polyangiaceae bacterium]|jgi:hypothetical protein